MKNFFIVVFLFLSFTSFANADFLLQQKNRCVVNFLYKKIDGSYKILYAYSSSPNTYYSSRSKSYTFLPGYVYSSDTNCTLPSIVKKLSLTASDYNFLMALTGLLIGFAFLLAVILIFKRGK